MSLEEENSKKMLRVRGSEGTFRLSGIPFSEKVEVLKKEVGKKITVDPLDFRLLLDLKKKKEMLSTKLIGSYGLRNGDLVFYVLKGRSKTERKASFADDLCQNTKKSGQKRRNRILELCHAGELKKVKSFSIGFTFSKLYVWKSIEKSNGGYCREMASPLYIACLAGNEKMVKYLLKKKVNVNLGYEEDELLSMNSDCGHSKVIHPVVAAIRSSNIKILKCLLACSPNLLNGEYYAHDKGGGYQHTCLQIAKEEKGEKSEFFQLINKKMKEGTKSKSPKKKKVVVKKKSNSKGKSSSSNLDASRVLKVCKKGDLTLLKKLKVDFNQKYVLADIRKSNGGFQYQKASPLYVACRNGHLGCVQFLLKQGVDVNLGEESSSCLSQNSDCGHSGSESPVVAALKAGKNGLKILKCLLSYSPDLSKGEYYSHDKGGGYNNSCLKVAEQTKGKNHECYNLILKDVNMPVYDNYK